MISGIYFFNSWNFPVKLSNKDTGVSNENVDKEPKIYAISKKYNF